MSRGGPKQTAEVGHFIMPKSMIEFLVEHPEATLIILDSCDRIELSSGVCPRIEELGRKLHLVTSNFRYRRHVETI